MTTSEFADTIEMETFYADLSAKDRSNIEKHLAVCDAEETADHGRLWRRLAVGMRRLGPLRPQTTGQRAVQFFAADGKYRVQMFALEDTRNRTIALYTADVVGLAVAAGLLRGPVEDDRDGNLYEVCELPGVTVKIEPLSAATTPTAPDYYRHMLGWNRKAVRITLPTDASPAQVKASEALCSLAARATGK